MLLEQLGGSRTRPLQKFRESLRFGFWAVPALCVLVAVVVAQVLVAVDRRREAEFDFTFGAGPDGAREVLGAITTAMITFTGLVFSITLVVLQLTSQQFSPRVLHTFLRDRQTQWSLGVFTATFVYAIMVLRTVDSGEDDQFVPAVGTTFALFLLLVSVGLFVTYIHHMATSVQVTSIMNAISHETRRSLDRRFPAEHGHLEASPDRPPQPLASAVVSAPRSGVVTTFDERALVAAAHAAGVLLWTGVRLGDFVPEGAPLLQVVGDASRLDQGAVLSAITQARDRTLQQDVAFGVRQLVDIGERALSPGTNDPTTAVQVLDQLHDLLRRLATRPLRTGVHTDEAADVRFVMPADRIEDYLHLALDGIDQYGADARPVQQRLDALLADIAEAALPAYRTAFDDIIARRRERQTEAYRNTTGR